MTIKPRTLLMIFTVSSLVIMLVIDYLIRAKAEFLNGWSVVERLFGQTPAAGDSIIYRSFDAVGELLGVVLSNLVIGGALTLVLRPWWYSR